MEHASIPDPPGFSNLSKAEQIRYLQGLWDRISENPVTFLSWSLISNLLKKDSRPIDGIRSEFAPPIRFWTGCAKSPSDRL